MIKKIVFVLSFVLLAGASLSPAQSPSAGPPASSPAAGSALLPTSTPARRLALRRTPLVDVYNECRDSIVHIIVTRRQEKPSTQPATASTTPAKKVIVTDRMRSSGFIIHPDGYILTNSHALRMPGQGEAILSGGGRYTFQVVARDITIDLAVLKIASRRPLKALKLGRSNDLMVGERAVCLGYPMDTDLTLAPGVVTGLERNTNTDFSKLHHMIQTDAGLNPGMSGGPMLNILGEVIGLSTSQKRDADGIAFASSIDTIRKALPAMLDPERRRGFVLGLSLDPLASGAVVSAVTPHSPADQAAIRPGDIVLRCDNHALANGIDLYLGLLAANPGQRISLMLARDQGTIELTLTLARAPQAPASAPKTASHPTTTQAG